MDPNEALKNAREAFAQFKTAQGRNFHDAAFEAQEAFDALDEWLSKDGFLPSDWNRDREESITVVWRESEAFTELEDCFAGKDTYKVSLQARKDGIAVKANEWQWSPTLSTNVHSPTTPEGSS